MTNAQWETLKRIIRGERVSPLPVGFIIDSPWLPNWYGITILDYFSSDELWLKANMKAVRDFPETLFLPGFWSEFGMCTEPSAFGAKCTFSADEFPFAHRVLRSAADIDALTVPDPGKDGLLPFMLNRLKLARPQIEASGHAVRFAVARGPLNIASYLMGSTEFLTTMMMQPDMAEILLKKVSAFLKNWLRLQMETFPSIDGILLLDDIIGFIGEAEFRSFALPRFKELYDEPVSVKFLHNDAPCRVSAPFLPEMGVNLYNMGFDVSLSELKQWTDNRITLLGNLPPRDVLAAKDPAGVSAATAQLLDTLKDKSRVIFSCGGGMPPGVSTENIRAFIRTVQSRTSG
jgi:uroporphyrinogen-III decarboxylase